MQSSKQGMLKGYHLSIEGIRKGYLFREKKGGASPYKHLLSTPPPPGLKIMVTDLQNPALFALLYDRPPEVPQFTCVETATENRKSLVLFK